MEHRREEGRGAMVGGLSWAASRRARVQTSGLLAIALSSVMLLLLAQPASATAITFTNRNAFDAAFPGAMIEGWDGFPSGTVIPNGSTVNGITYFSSNGNALVTNVFVTTTSPNGLGETTNGFFLATDTIRFMFGIPISAWGIDINTFATANGAYRAVTNAGDVIGSFFNPFPGFGTGQFLGFSTDTPFTSITISAPGGVSYTLDTMRRNPVPEPATLTLLGLGLFGVARRRFAKK